MDVTAPSSVTNRPPRGRLQRAALAATLWLVVLAVGPFVVATVILALALLLTGNNPTVLAIGQWVGVVVGWVGPLAVLAWLCPKVSYRWFDCLMLAIPISGQLIWAPRIMWRLAYLPYRDWRPRPDEARGWVQFAEPASRGQSPIYVARS
jgi:hypothetical protein